MSGVFEFPFQGETLIADAEAALAMLQDHPAVDGDRVGLFGHSAGGWVVARANMARSNTTIGGTRRCRSGSSCFCTG